MGVELISGWKQSWRLASVWFFIVLGALPDIFNLAVSMNVIDAQQAPEILARIVNLVAFIGVVSRLIRQKKLEADINVKKEAGVV